MNIDKKEVFRYLRYQSQVVDSSIDNIIDMCIDEVKKEATPSFTYQIFDIKKNSSSIILENSILDLGGTDIYNHLNGSEKCAVMAATLGIQIDRLIKYYSKTDMTKCLILDACATAAIEWLCDEIEDEIRKYANKNEYKLTNRYSPGYGDLKIETQPSILKTLNTQVKIGLTVTDSLILIPRKSVTAFIGLGRNLALSTSVGCENCNSFNTCMYTREGKYCGTKKHI